MSLPFIDLKSQYHQLKSDIDQRIQRVLDHGQYILGPEVLECEQALAKFTGSEYCITVASGTDALYMALLSVGVKPGDEVIVPAFSFFATAEVVALLNATPVFVDVQKNSFNMDPEKLEEAISEKTKVIMPVSLYGQVADMDEINSIAKKHNLIVIEDAAQSFGATYKGKRSCNLSDFGATSFFPAKPLGCYGDGGAIFTNSKESYEQLISIRNHGQEGRYHHVRLGINGRLDTLQCAVLLSKLSVYQEEIEKRQMAASYYTEKFQVMEGVQVPQLSDNRDSVWAQYTLRVKDRESFQKKMMELGVPTAVHYPSVLSEQPALDGLSKVYNVEVAKKAAHEVVSLPMHPYLTPDVQDQVISAVEKCI
ncbi:MAG: DegT/DnrJ/EryC1/StrS family aminotransferase [Bdellovibrionales bacterium]|nr:DegT/DnrJ/EryC1/StrS family aminotransferase [Bdellovibrionales bacterium]